MHVTLLEHQERAYTL